MEITGTLGVCTEFAGKNKAVIVTATVESSSDTITLTEEDHGIQSIAGIKGAVITGGLDAAFTSIQVSFSGLVLTVDSFEQDGTPATDFTGTTVSLSLIGNL